MKVLVIAEHRGGDLRPATLSALGFGDSVAQQTAGSLTCLVIGAGAARAATACAAFAPTCTLVSSSLEGAAADLLGSAIAQVVRAQSFDLVVAAATSWSKDVLGRAGGLLGGSMASDVVAHSFCENAPHGTELHLERNLFAGSVRATVRLIGGPKVVTVRASSYAKMDPAPDPFPVTPCEVALDLAPSRVRIVETSSASRGRKDVTEARIVVSGGRAWKSSEDFEQHVGRLADLVGGAAGSSRVLVDAGITPNELQVGQTGKIVAPDLYLALGISGAMQHLAGMRNSKCIAAINEDPHAPIFQVCDYGLVGDVYELVPQLIEALEALGVQQPGDN